MRVLFGIGAGLIGVWAACLLIAVLEIDISIIGGMSLLGGLVCVVAAGAMMLRENARLRAAQE